MKFVFVYLYFVFMILSEDLPNIVWPDSKRKTAIRAKRPSITAKVKQGEIVKYCRSPQPVLLSY